MSTSRKARALLMAGVLAQAPLTARAEDASEQTPSDPVAGCGEEQPCPATVPETEPPRQRLWTLAASAGVSARDDGPDGDYQAISLTRGIGRAYLRAGMMRYHGTLLQADTALPSDYLIGTVAGGGNFNNWVVDGWVSYGRQFYGKISSSGVRRESTGAKSSDYYALGGDVGRILTLAPDWYLTPTVAGSFAHGKLLRPAPAGLGKVDLETDEPTWSANAAVRIDHAFGQARNHYVGLSLSRNWTSNAVSQVEMGPMQKKIAIATGSLSSRHTADAWFEIGMTANMQLTDDLALDLYATRGFDALAGNTTSAGFSLRRSF